MVDSKRRCCALSLSLSLAADRSSEASTAQGRGGATGPATPNPARRLRRASERCCAASLTPCPTTMRSTSGSLWRTQVSDQSLRHAIANVTQQGAAFALEKPARGLRLLPLSAVSQQERATGPCGHVLQTFPLFYIITLFIQPGLSSGLFVRKDPIKIFPSSFPSLPPASPCELHCRPVVEYFSERMLDAVTDGTPCFMNNVSRNICVNGVCKVVWLGKRLKERGVGVAGRRRV